MQPQMSPIKFSPSPHVFSPFKVEMTDGELDATLIYSTQEEQKFKASALLQSMEPRLGMAVDMKFSNDSVQHGVRVTGVLPNSAAALGGIEEGDFIYLFNGVPVNSHIKFAAEQRRCLPGDDVSLKVIRPSAGREYELIVRMGAKGFTREQVAKVRATAAADAPNMLNVVRHYPRKGSQ